MPERNNKKPPYTLVEMLRIIPRSSLPIGVAWNKCEEAADRIEALEAALREILQVGSATENLALWVAQDIASHALAGEKNND